MELTLTGDILVLDDRSSGDLHSRLGAAWRIVSDRVMGGISSGTLTSELVSGRSSLRMRGTVSLENNGGFLQASLDLSRDGGFNARHFRGVELDVFGNGERYNVHLRTADTQRVWQSYRAGFDAPPGWNTVRLAFAKFVPHRLEAPLDLRQLKRIGLVAIGRAFGADLCVARLALYR